MDSGELGWLVKSQCLVLKEGDDCNGGYLTRRTSNQCELCSPQDGIDIEMGEVKSLLQILLVNIDGRFSLWFGLRSSLACLHVALVPEDVRLALGRGGAHATYALSARAVKREMAFLFVWLGCGVNCRVGESLVVVEAQMGFSQVISKLTKPPSQELYNASTTAQAGLENDVTPVCVYAVDLEHGPFPAPALPCPTCLLGRLAGVLHSR